MKFIFLDILKNGDIYMNIINLFLAFSILGNIFERIVMHFIDSSYVSGFMGTIFTPIYGIAILIILFIHSKVKIKNKVIKLLLEFVLFSIILSLIELLGGILIETIFNKIYWNYDSLKFNIGKYISLETALIWGIVSLITLYLIYPIYKKIEKYIPKFLTIIIGIFFIINLIYIIIVK